MELQPLTSHSNNMLQEPVTEYTVKMEESFTWLSSNVMSHRIALRAPAMYSSQGFGVEKTETVAVGDDDL